MRSAALIAAFGAAVAATDAIAVDAVVEFYNAILDHYFITISPAEAAAIDDGSAGPGWHRTARVFGAYASSAAAPPDAVAVCRFYGNTAAGGPNSHFFTADAGECDAVKTDPGWRFEGIAYYVRTPTAGACPAGTRPVRRNYNRRFAQRDSNHRYATENSLYDDMNAIGWAGEGIVMCGDPAVATPPRTAPVVVTGASPFAADCERAIMGGFAFANSEVEPFISVDPRAPDHWIGVWQQDRWSNGGARGLVAAATFDGGRTWQKSAAAFSRCTGGTVADGGDYLRASDPWVSFAPNGVAYQVAIAFSGVTGQPSSQTDVAVSRSRDGGITWDPTIVLIRDAGGQFFNDKESVTADRTDARYAYAVWDRIDPAEIGMTWFARTRDGGDSWEPARPIYDPGPGRSTINNQIVVLPDGTLIDFFTELTFVNGQVDSARMAAMRSADKGATWSTPTVVANVMAVGARDPETGTAIRDGSGLGQIAGDDRGRLFVVWQDGRMSGGARDAVLLTTSTDAGRTWSSPARVNADLGVAAFIPAIAIARDGTIGVSYYDFRNNTADPATLPADYWLARSTDGVTWTETHIDGPFDYGAAPLAGGLFLGDYQGLATAGNAFVPFFSRANSHAPLNRSDIVSAFIPALATAAVAAVDERVNAVERSAAGERIDRIDGVRDATHADPAWTARTREALEGLTRARRARIGVGER